MIYFKGYGTNSLGIKGKQGTKNKHFCSLKTINVSYLCLSRMVVESPKTNALWNLLWILESSIHIFDVEFWIDWLKQNKITKVLNIFKKITNSWTQIHVYSQSESWFSTFTKAVVMFLSSIMYKLLIRWRGLTMSCPKGFTWIIFFPSPFISVWTSYHRNLFQACYSFTAAMVNCTFYILRTTRPSQGNSLNKSFLFQKYMVSCFANPIW